MAIFNPAMTLLGHSAYWLVVIVVYFSYRDLAPVGRMQFWIWLSVVAFSMSALFCIAFFIRRPGPDETIRVWRRIDKRFTHIFDAVAVGAIFLLFPYGTQTHQLVALAFCVGYGPLQLVVDPDNVSANRISVIVILSAYAAQLYLSGNAAWPILSAMFLIYGPMLIYGAGVFRKAVVESIKGRRRSERDMVAVTAAHDEVMASRDAKTRFIASASHDLGQPLQAASLFVRQLKVEPLAPQQEKAVEAIESALSSARGLVSHMTNYLRLESDAVRPDLIMQPLGPILARAIQQSRCDSPIQLRVAATSRMALVDSGLLVRAVANLISNSVKHAHANRILVGIKSAGRECFRICVIDDGKGISEADRLSLFEDYFQGSAAAPGGFGLGLASVRRIALLHRGTASLDERWTNGSAFYIEMPK